jgi:hypothetical protein
LENQSLFEHEPVREECDQPRGVNRESNAIGNGGEWFVAAVLKNPSMVPTWCGRCFIEFQEQGRVFDLRATSADGQREFKVQVKTASGARSKREGLAPVYDFGTAKIDKTWARNNGKDPYTACRRLYDPADVDLFAFVAEDRFCAVFLPAFQVSTTSVAISPQEFTIENQRASLRRAMDAIVYRRRPILAMPAPQRRDGDAAVWREMAG